MAELETKKAGKEHLFAIIEQSTQVLKDQQEMFMDNESDVTGKEDDTSMISSDEELDRSDEEGIEALLDENIDDGEDQNFTPEALETDEYSKEEAKTPEGDTPEIADSSDRVEPGEAKDASEITNEMDLDVQEVTSSKDAVGSVQVPPLLKHTLREYQHSGLSWLVGLESKNLNGILADEMVVISP